MQNFIPDEEIRKDQEIAKDAFYGEAYKRGISPIELKRNIGAKYGLSPKECSKSNNILNAILVYLREIRKYKHDYTREDVHDFYDLTNSNSKYNKLEPFLMLESSRFIKFLLDHQYQYLIDRGIKQYTLDNIDKITIGQSVARSAQDRFFLERYKSIKKYYDEHYGNKTEQTKVSNKLKSNLYSILVEETYDIRLQLEQYLEDFILECYDTYIYNSSEFTRLHNLLNDYYDQVRSFNPTHDIHHIAGTEERKLIEYRDNLHFLCQLFTYFSEEQSKTSKVTRERRIECSLEDFNKKFDKLLEKNILNSLVSKNVENIKIGELIKCNFGYYFEISYDDNKKLYINFIIQHDTSDTSDMDKFIKHPRLYTTNVVNYSVIDYQMKVTTKPLNKKLLNESFNFNVNLSLDDYEDDEMTTSKMDVINDDKTMENFVQFFNCFVDLGLPSGTLWCKYNLGVDTDNLDKFGAWHGHFYAWGELEPRSRGSNYFWTTYKLASGSYNNLKKYLNGNTDYAAKDFSKQYKGPGTSIRFNDNLKELLPEDDAAYQHLYFGKYHSHIPTKEQCKELLDNTTRIYCEKYNNISGLEGILLKSKINNNEVFFPITGYMNGGALIKITGDDKQALFWNNSIGPRYEEYTAGFVSLCKQQLETITNYLDRSFGLPIRPVYNS